jgi:hypothetical protein
MRTSILSHSAATSYTRYTCHRTGRKPLVSGDSECTRASQQPNIITTPGTVQHRDEMPGYVLYLYTKISNSAILSHTNVIWSHIFARTAQCHPRPSYTTALWTVDIILVTRKKRERAQGGCAGREAGRKASGRTSHAFLARVYTYSSPT